MLLVCQGYETTELVDEEGNRKGIKIEIKLDQTNQVYEITPEEAAVAKESILRYRNGITEETQEAAESHNHSIGPNFKEKTVLLLMKELEEKRTCILKDVKNVARSKGIRWVNDFIIKYVVEKFDLRDERGRIAPGKASPYVEHNSITYEGLKEEFNEKRRNLGSVTHPPVEDVEGGEWGGVEVSIPDYQYLFNVSYGEARQAIRKFGDKRRVGNEERVFVPKEKLFGDF